MKNVRFLAAMIAAASLWCLCSMIMANELPAPGYAIVTTKAIQADSSKLADFVEHKRSLGFNVQVATEVDFGGGMGDGAAKNIRRWLQEHYFSHNIKYVLLVGNSHPKNGEIPMKMIWSTASHKGVPSDLYYADLTGNWDWNGDGLYGMRPEDFGPGGVDTFYEVLIGRIPFYGSIEDLDAILQKTINYETQRGDAIEWRKNVLLAKPNPSKFPKMFEDFKDNCLVPMGWAYHRVYGDDFGLVPPPETVPCTIENVTDVWSNGTFGLVMWWTHGGAHGASNVMNSAHVPYLNDSYPAFVVGISCANATVEVDDNLAYSLLKHGAICTVAGTRGESRMSWLGRDYVSMIVVEGLTCGEALQEVRAWQFGVGWNTLNVFNLYGDPSLRIIPSEPSSRRRFVNCRAAHGGDGLSWETAYNDLQDALDEIVRLGIVREIWVAAGTYRPDRRTGNRAATFRFDKGIEVYGGFTGSETDLDQRDPATNLTVLSGDIGIPGDSSDNSYHVVTFKDTHVGALIDGFTISGGNANGAEQADKNGGGIHNLHSSPTLTNCIFRANVAAESGGALYSLHKWDVVTLTNCIFSNNIADKGGGMYLNSTARMANCTFSGNSANQGGGIYNDDESYVMLTDCILWGNSDVSHTGETAQICGRTRVVNYSCIQDDEANDTSVYPGTGNIDADPLFVAAEFGDYYLSQTAAGQDKNSPCVDAGSGAAANGGLNRLATRTDEVVDNGTLDMGYHYFVSKHADLDSSGNVDLVDFAKLAADWLLCGDPCHSNHIGGYLPADLTKPGYLNLSDLKVLTDNWLDCYVTPASYPRPIDNARDVVIRPVLFWLPGYEALDHNVYLGTDADVVANADKSSAEFMGTVSNVIFDPDRLSYNKTYYWRIDEVGAACTTEGDIWSFTTGSAIAKTPSPADGAEAVFTDVVLSWSPGAGAVSHEIYLGTDANAVTNAAPDSDEYKGNQNLASYATSGLEHNTTYYWRIDEVDDLYTHKGKLYSFTTGHGLVGWWKFDEGDGTTAYDSADDNHGIVYGAQWTTGQIGGALNFDGVDDYVAMPGFNRTTNTVTFVAWINGWKPSREGSWAGIVFSRTPAGDACGMNFGSNNTLHYTWNEEEHWRWEGGPEIPKDQWAMVAVAIEPDKATAYVYTDAKGLQQGVNSIPHVPLTIDNLKVGWDEHRNSRRFRGTIDDVRIYNRALSAEKIQALSSRSYLAGDR